jgi:hypothetical protein
MRSTMKLIALLAAALCLGASIAASASGAPKTLHLTYSHPTEVKLSPGQQVEGWDRSWSLETSAGSVYCYLNEHNEGFLGSDETNDQKMDYISVTSVFGGFSTNSECTSQIAVVGNPVRGIWFNGNTGDFDVAGKWKFGTKATGEYLTSASHDTVIGLESSTAPRAYCLYEVKKLKGQLGVYPEEINLSFSKQKVKLLKTLPGLKSAAGCPKTAAVSTLVQFYVQLGAGEEASLGGNVG